jgi:hypothetical protein
VKVARQQVAPVARQRVGFDTTMPAKAPGAPAGARFLARCATLQNGLESSSAPPWLAQGHPAWQMALFARRRAKLPGTMSTRTLTR